VFTYLVTPRLKLSPDLMIYARLASGFRPAQPSSPSPGIPGESSPDKTKNYELGVKTGFFDDRLSLDASVYYIQYNSLQLVVKTDTTIYNANGGDAKSEGVELSFVAKPLSGLTVSGWVSYDDAVLTDNFPASSTSYGVVGNRLPAVSKWSGNLSLEERFPLWNGAMGFVGATASYVGDRIGDFTPRIDGVTTAPPRQYLPTYTQTDLRAGVEYDSWVASMYVNNVTNRRGLIGGGLDAFPSYAFTYVQPRTIGLTVTKTF
jgi:outer membrane receptor protein involved in Fe transport